MNVIEQARQAYAPSHFPLRTPRSVEAELIAKITSNLKRQAANRKVDFPSFVAALHDNRQMWTAMAVDVAGQENGLPAPLRAQIFYLAEFTEKQSRKIIVDGLSVDALVDVNTSVLRGLNAMRGQ